MNLPQLMELPQTRSVLQEFKGYNHNIRINEGEWYEMENMTCDLYPVMTQRKRRGKVRTFEKLNGIFEKNGMVYVDKTSLYYKNEIVGSVTNSKKTFCGMGAYVLIFPDKVYFNTNDEKPVLKKMEAEWSSTGSIEYKPCTLDGTAISAEHYKEGVTNPYPATQNGDYWLDTSTNPSVLKMWQESTSQWVSVPTSYVRIESTGIGKEFNRFDVVNISGSAHEKLNMDMCIWNKEDNYIVVIALLDSTEGQGTKLTIKRKVPDMDFVCESENRIWGCSNKNHEVYCSKQGDPTNWYSYLGNANDSYAATIASDGDFTGCVAHLSYVLFFKKDRIHKVYGSMPSNYQITEVGCRGVQEGSEKSIRIVNETLFYKSDDGVCVYEGGLPISISYCMGEKRYTDGVAGVIGGKYYLSMKDGNGIYHMFVYDTGTRMWTKEDDVRALDFMKYKGSLYFVDENNVLWCVDGREGTEEEPFTWMVESGDIGLSLPESKYISKLSLRLDIEYGGEMEIELMYDSSGEWKKEYKLASKTKKSKKGLASFTKLRSLTVPVIPRRCDHLKMRLSGVGKCRIYSITETIEQGSDVT